MFGTMEEMRTLIRQAKARGIGILLDWCSTTPATSTAGSGRLCRVGTIPTTTITSGGDGTPDTPPNGMRAGFGGSAWTWVPELGQYYFHQFAPQQPDLNWDNPKVRQELYAMIRGWMAEGGGRLPAGCHRPGGQGPGPAGDRQRPAADGVSAGAEPGRPSAAPT